MAIAASIFIGAIVGCLASFLYRPSNTGAFTSLGVGILGSLLGLATVVWLGRGPMAYFEYVASGAGAVLLLLLWVVAQRLFLATPPPVTRD